jgi:heme/copper-type cytochrome/quinol oxidase subunit 2
MQAPRKHLPVVGLLGLVIIAAAGGTVYYYQFASPHTHGIPAHRLVFMTAVIQELGGFHVNNTAFLNQTTLPAFDTSKGYNLTSPLVKFQDYIPAYSDNKTINANAGDTITFYIHGVDGSGHGFPQSSTAHGFEIDGPTVSVAPGGVLPGTIPFGQWYTVTVTFNTAGSYTYRCSIVCSQQHMFMTGSIVVS